MKIDVKNLAGKKIEELVLADDVFGVKVKDKILHQVYVAQYANRRSNIAHTKTRGEIRGSTKKPWKQKGTGRARTGSVKNPIWRSGGIIFGPRNDRNFSKKINKKVRRLAMKMVLSGKLTSKQLVVIDNYKVTDLKTKIMARSIKSLKIKKNSLLVFDNQEKKYCRASRNLIGIKNVMIETLNVFDLLNSKNLVLSKRGIKFLEDKYKKIVI